MSLPVSLWRMEGCGALARLRSLGMRPLAGGLATALLVGGVSYALIRWIAPVATRLIG